VQWQAQKLHHNGWGKKIFTFCPQLAQASTAGLKNIEYNSYEHLKQVVHEKMA